MRINKSIILIFIVFLIVLVFIGCDSEESKPEESITKTMLLKYNAWGYESIDALKSKNTKERKLFYFGNKFTIEEEKMLGEGDKAIEIVMFSLPDDSQYYIKKSYLTEKFIVVTDNDLICYEQPSKDWIENDFKLQKGDFGYFGEEKDGFIKVWFFAYSPRGLNGQVIRPGWTWLKSGYNDSDLQASKEAYYLNYAYNYMYRESVRNYDKAMSFIEEALNVNAGIETFVTPITKSVKEEIEEEIKGKQKATEEQESEDEKGNLDNESSEDDNN